MTPFSWPVFLSLWSLGCLAFGLICGTVLAARDEADERENAERAREYAIRLLTDPEYLDEQREILAGLATSRVVGMDVSEIGKG